MITVVNPLLIAVSKKLSLDVAEDGYSHFIVPYTSTAGADGVGAFTLKIASEQPVNITSVAGEEPPPPQSSSLGGGGDDTEAPNQVVQDALDEQSRKPGEPWTDSQFETRTSQESLWLTGPQCP